MPGPGFMSPLPSIDISANDVNNAVNNVGAADTVYGGVGLANQAGLPGVNDASKIGGVLGNKWVSGGEGALGTFLGGYQVGQGVGEIMHGQYTQGGMDVGAGGLGVAAGAASLAEAGAFGAGAMGAGAAAGAFLGPAALVAGLAAAGNGYSQQHGWWGKDANGNNKDSIQWTADNAVGAYNDWNKKAGGGLGGTVVGGVAGGLAGLGSGAAALGADVVGGVASTTETLGNAVGGLFGNSHAGTGIVDGVGTGLSAAGNFLAPGAKAVGNFLSPGLNAVGSMYGAEAKMVGTGINTAASAIGSGVHAVSDFAGNAAGAIGNGAKAIGSGIGSAASTVGHALSHLW